MASVVNLSGNIPANASNTDNPMCAPNRNNAGTPVSALTPLWVGEVVLDTTNRVIWRAFGPLTTQWEPTNTNIS